MFLNDIKNTILVEDEYLCHDPIDPELIYNNNKQIYKSFKRNSMWFAKPIKNQIYYYSYFTEDYVCLIDEESKSYYRPVEFYDHYLTPYEIDNLSNDEIEKYIIQLQKENLCFNENLYKSFLEHRKYNTEVSFIKFLQYFIKLNKYNLLNFSNELYTKGDIYFDETWNTINYYHLLVPRKKQYFINTKKFKCNCINFKDKKTCYHIHYYIAKQILNNFFKNSVLELHIMSVLKKFLN